MVFCRKKRQEDHCYAMYACRPFYQNSFNNDLELMCSGQLVNGQTIHFIAVYEVETPRLDNDLEKTGNRKNSEYYTVMQEALRDYGIDADLAPSWYPSDVTISGPEIVSTDYNDIIYFSFSDGKSSLRSNL